MGGVCFAKQTIFLSTVLSNKYFCWLKQTLKIVTTQREFVRVPLHTNYKNLVCELFISKNIFSESDFCAITPHFFKSYLENVLSFSTAIEYGKRRHVCPETEEKIKLTKNKIRFDLWLSKGDLGARI